MGTTRTRTRTTSNYFDRLERIKQQICDIREELENMEGAAYSLEFNESTNILTLSKDGEVQDTEDLSKYLDNGIVVGNADGTKAEDGVNVVSLDSKQIVAYSPHLVFEQGEAPNETSSVIRLSDEYLSEIPKQVFYEDREEGYEVARDESFTPRGLWTLTEGSFEIEGEGTYFTEEVFVGDTWSISYQGYPAKYIIESVESDTLATFIRHPDMDIEYPVGVGATLTRTYDAANIDNSMGEYLFIADTGTHPNAFIITPFIKSTFIEDNEEDKGKVLKITGEEDKVEWGNETIYKGTLTEDPRIDTTISGVKTFTSGSDTVTGVNTSFLEELVVGDLISFGYQNGSAPFEVAEIISDNELRFTSTVPVSGSANNDEETNVGGNYYFYVNVPNPNYRKEAIKTDLAETEHVDKVLAGKSEGVVDWKYVSELEKSGQLIKVTENGKTGWGLASVTREFIDYTGENSLDFSHKPYQNGDRVTTGDYSVMFGFDNSVEGYLAFVGGTQASAKGLYGFAYGTGVKANAQGSFAVNTVAVANGRDSAAIGYGTQTEARGEMSVGMFPTRYTIDSDYVFGSGTDRMFNVGNGTPENEPLTHSDAFTVYRNGAVKLHPIDPTVVTNMSAGVFIVDATDSNKLKYHDGTALRTISFV